MSKAWTLLVAAVVGLCAGIRTPVSAQGLEGSRIDGVVRDGTARIVVGATVSLTGTHLIGGSRETATDDRGEFHFSVLPIGTYQVTVDAAGFARTVRSGVVLPLAATVRIELALAPAPVVDVVNVTTAPPLVDLRRSAIVTNVEQSMLQALPVRRVLGEVLALAPGILNPTPVPGLVVSFGGTAGSNGLYVDGVDITEPRRQSAWLRVNYNWVEQVQIASVGAGAEYGEFTGAVGSATLRSGSDRYSGLAEYWTTRWQWIDRNGPSFAGREILSWWDSSAQVGGPLRRERAWFFAGAQLYRRKDQPLGHSGPGTASERTPSALLKLTSAIADATRLEGHIQYNSRDVDAANANQLVAVSGWNVVRQRDVTGNVRLSRTFGPHTFFEARSGGYTSRLDDGPRFPNTIDGPPPSYESTTRVTSSNVLSYEFRDVSQWNSAAKVIREIPRPFGSHTLEAALEFKVNDSAIITGYPGGRQLFTTDGSLTSITEWQGDRTQAGGRRTAIYAQDRWTLSSHLTLNAGLRVDFNRGSIPERGTILSTNLLSPRFGVAWTLDASHKTVLKLHLGRYYDTLLTERVAFMDVPGIRQRTYYNVDPSGELVFRARDAVPTARDIDPDIRHSYMNQYLVALEREVFRNTLFQAFYTRSDYADFMGIVDTGSQWTTTRIQDPGPDGRFQTPDDGPFFTAYRNTNPGSRFLYYTNPSDAFRRYHGLQLAAVKRLSDDWQVQGSYTWSRTVSTAGNGDSVNAGLNDTGEFAFTRLPAVFVNPNGLINAEGRAPYEVRELKVLGSYHVPIAQGLLMSGILRRHGGNRWERTAQYFDVLIPGQPQTIRVEPRGSRVSDRVWNLDLRLEKTIRMIQGRLDLAVEVFNVLNQGEPLQYLGVSGSSFGLPITRNDPRTGRLLVRYSF